MEHLRYTGGYPEEVAFEVDNMAVHEAMPPGLIERPGGGPLSQQWLLMWFHTPAEVQLAGSWRPVHDQVVLWPPGQAHRLGHRRRAWDHSWCLVRGRRFARLVRAAGTPCLEPLPVGEAVPAENCLRDCVAELLRPDRDPVIVEHLLGAWLRRLTRATTSDGRMQGLRVARALMEDRLDHEWTLAELAAAAGLAPTWFAQRFRQAYGQAPIAALIDLRLRRAQELLMGTRLPIAAIAERVGFRDGRHFSRSFRRLFGCPPRAWRGRQRAAEPGPLSPMSRW
ncbi:MAG: helix-turn-helix domain-containing protein [Planctomycetota bacterium]